jgi:hypothetical protein
MQKPVKKQEKNNKFITKNKKLNIKSRAIKSSGRPFFNISIDSLKKKQFYRLNITLFSNNVFCSLKDNKEEKLILLSSAGKYKMKVSKKTLKYSSDIIITKFFKDLKKKRVKLNKPIVFVLVAPIHLKKRIIIKVLTFLKFIKNKRIIVYIKPKKVFNGCRAKKAIRKKKKRHALYK